MSTDVNYQSHWGEKGLRIRDEILPPPVVNPKSFSDILKFSVCEDVVVSNCTINGGQENCSDAVRGKGYNWTFCNLVMQQPGLGALTIKGAIDGWTLDSCMFIGHGSQYDVEVGQFSNYWKPFDPPTKHGQIISCAAYDGQPIVVHVWNAEVPGVLNSNVKIIKHPWIEWFPYFLFRYIQTKLNPPNQ